MNYKKIIDALIVLNKNAKSVTGLEALNFNLVSEKLLKSTPKEINLYSQEYYQNLKMLENINISERDTRYSYSTYNLLDYEISSIEKKVFLEVNFVKQKSLISLYKIKDFVIRKLIAHGQLKGDSYHSFTRGGLSKSLKSKFAKKDDSGKVIGEFHNSLCKYHKAFAGLKYDGILASHQDKTQGFYQNKMDLAQSIYVLSEFIDNDNFSKKKEKKYTAMAKRRNYL